MKERTLEIVKYLCTIMSIDLLWYEQLNWSPYHYCGNDPVNGRDGSGLAWFVSSDGKINWKEQNGSYSDVKTGVTYYDMGNDFLFFNGANIELYQSDKTGRSWNAVSGKLKDGNSDYENQYNKGCPIPEGTHYRVDPNKIQEYKDLSYIKQTLSNLGLAGWRGGTSSWGNIRVPIEPGKDNRGERTGGYFIHGGDTPGSRGCIDLWKNNDSFFNIFGTYKHPLPLVVIYPNKK